MRNRHDIAAERFLLGHRLPEHVNPQLYLLERLSEPTPKVNPALSTFAEIEAMKSADYPDDGSRKAAEARLVNNPESWWNHLVLLAQDPAKAIWARIFLDEINRAPTFESRFSYTYAFWQAICDKSAARHADYMGEIAFGNGLYRAFLNASDNVGPNSARGRGLVPDQNFPREFSEIISAGPFFLDNDGDALDEWSLLLTGLQVLGYDPASQEPGARVVKGNTFAVNVDSPRHIHDAIEWISMRPETARYQSLRLAWLLLGDGLTPRLHTALAEKWLATGGNRREVLKALFAHDDAWNPARAAPVNPLHGILTYFVENALPLPRKGGVAFGYPQIGYRYERAPNALGGMPLLSYDCINAFFMSCRINWPGTDAMRARAISHERILV